MPEASTRPIVDLDRDESVFEELALGLVVLLGVLEADVGGRATIPHREQVLRLVDIGLDAGDELPFGDDIAGANREVHHLAGEVGFDLHLDLRFDRAHLTNHNLDIVDARGQGRDLGALFLFAVAICLASCCVRDCCGCNHNHSDENQPTLLLTGHEFPLIFRQRLDSL
jgi:hypothetical protein